MFKIKGVLLWGVNVCFQTVIKIDRRISFLPFTGPPKLDRMKKAENSLDAL